MTVSDNFKDQIKTINQTRSQTLKKINGESNKAEFAHVQAFYKRCVLTKLDVANKVESKMIQLIIQTLDILDKNYSSSSKSKHTMSLKLIDHYKALIGNTYIAVIHGYVNPQALVKNPLEYPHYEEIDLDHLDEYTDIIHKFDDLSRQNIQA